MPKERLGYEQEVGRFRAVATTTDLDIDPNPMVQELVSRLWFLTEQLPLEGKDILDYGCGTGLALEWLRSHTRPGRLVGLDISEGAIAAARAQYPGIEFHIANIESTPLGVGKDFDIALCFEVLEHLKNPDRTLAHLAASYLKPDGIFVASTPNRNVFSAGMEPSPINRTHLHEMDLDELRSLLTGYFKDVRIWGMRFRDPARTQAQIRMAKHACDGSRIFGDLWWNPLVSRLYRWVWRREIWHLLAGRQQRRWMAHDLEFIGDAEKIARTAIWFYAIAAHPIGGS
jgi:SAM-dependent methyltransferase